MLGSSALVTVVHGSHTSWTRPQNRTLVGRGKSLLKMLSNRIICVFIYIYIYIYIYRERERERERNDMSLIFLQYFYNKF